MGGCNEGETSCQISWQKLVLDHVVCLSIHSGRASTQMGQCARECLELLLHLIKFFDLGRMSGSHNFNRDCPKKDGKAKTAIVMWAA